MANLGGRPQIRKETRSIAAALSASDPSKMVERLERDGRIVVEIDGEPGVKGELKEDPVPGREQIVLTPEDLQVRTTAREGFAVETAGDTFAILDTDITRDLMLEGIAREIVSKVQMTRKNKGFNVTDHIRMSIESDAVVGEAIGAHKDYITGDTLCDEQVQGRKVAGSDVWDLNGHKARITIENLSRAT